MTRHPSRREGLHLAAALLILTAPFFAGETYSDDGAAHQLDYDAPIPLGVSGGNASDKKGPACCGGTLGALVEDANGIQYVLSNNHVLARFNAASLGEDILQPALIDVECSSALAEVVADLSGFVTISTSQDNTVDAAIAEIRANGIDSTGAILDIGTVAGETLDPTVGLAVRKSGRTSGLTAADIDAIDVTLDVAYSVRCGSGQTKVARFVGAFRVGGASFSDSGDSGSLVVEDVAANPRAVGLLFAGSGTDTFCNPIGAVLDSFGVTLVGEAPPPPVLGSISGTVTSASDAAAIGGALVQTDTGETAVTDDFGAYFIANVPAGSRGVTASASGYESAQQTVLVAENLTATLDFALAAAVQPANAIVDCITFDTFGGGGGTKHLEASVAVVDDFGDAVAGASVSVDLTFPSGSVGTATGTTDTAGIASFVAHNAPGGCYVLDVTAITVAGLAFDGAEPANGFDKGTDAVPDADCRSGSTPCAGPAGGTSARLSLPFQASVQAARNAKQKHESDLFALPGVVGVGVGIDPEADSAACIEVYLKHDPQGQVWNDFETLDDVPVRLIVTGEIAGRAGCVEP